MVAVALHYSDARHRKVQRLVQLSPTLSPFCEVLAALQSEERVTGIHLSIPAAVVLSPTEAVGRVAYVTQPEAPDKPLSLTDGKLRLVAVARGEPDGCVSVARMRHLRCPMRLQSACGSGRHTTP
jgi:hypothetical protein